MSKKPIPKKSLWWDQNEKSRDDEVWVGREPGSSRVAAKCAHPYPYIMLHLQFGAKIV